MLAGAQVRTLSPTLRAFLDPATARPAFGSYEGPLPPVVLACSPVDRALRCKKWLWLAISSGDVWLSMAIVRTGYAASAFAFVFDRVSRKMVVDRTIVAPRGAAEIADDAHASGVLAGFAFGRSRAVFERRGETCEVLARFADLEVEATLDESTSPPPVSAIARLSPTLMSATEKRALCEASGRVIAAGHRFSLDGGYAGYDYTHGLMPRRTRWRWAFAMGHTRMGEPVAFNLTQGFVGESECAAFLRGRARPLREPSFDFDAGHPDRPWTIRAHGVDLTFSVAALHRQDTNLWLVRSRFVQPVGVFHGTMRVGDEAVELDGLPGVVEDQDVVW